MHILRIERTIMRKTKIYLAILTLFSLAHLAPLHAQSLVAHGTERPRNIIFFIGDGMGVSQISAGKIVKGRLQLERLPVGGLVTTHAEAEFVTDSAASGTAMATGVKTYNGAISVTNDGQPLKTVFEYAEERRMSTGLVVTCTLTHATPAVFVAHSKSRDLHNEIAEGITTSGVDVLIGGGSAYFLPQSVEGSEREDERDLLQALRDDGMTVAASLEAYRSLDHTPDRLAAFLALEDPKKIAERGYTLSEVTLKALDILSQNDRGFILMVEGSQIDWGGHDNDTDYIVTEMIDFDDAVGVGLDFARRHGDTLVVVTADHETGGMSLLDGSIEKRELSEVKYTTDEHSAVMVPIFAYGPGSGAFGGIHDNTHIGRTLIKFVTGR